MIHSAADRPRRSSSSNSWTNTYNGTDFVRQDFLGNQQERNRETLELSDSYQGHREQVMKLIRATVKDLNGAEDGQCSSVILLGAGNCLDVDLPTLAKQFAKIHLVDVDAMAVTTAAQQSGVSGQCEIHAPADIAEPLMSLTTRDFSLDPSNNEHSVNVLQALTSEHGVADVPPADVVISLCVFSQIVETFGRLVGEDHPVFGHGLKAIRLGHLRRLLSMLRPGGVAVFISDVVSSDTSDELKTATLQSTPELVKKLVNAGNFFSGANPALMLADLNMLTRLPGGPESVHTIDPWPWRMGDRVYAVYAFRIQKAQPVKEVTEEINMDEIPEAPR
jgi:hypothetical protein